MQHHAADELHIEVPLAKRALGRLAHRRERFGQQIVEVLAIGQPLAELVGLAAQFIVRERQRIAAQER